MTRLLSREQFEASLRVLLTRETDESNLYYNIINPNGMISVNKISLTLDDLIPDKVFYRIPVYFGAAFTYYHPDFYRLDVLQQILEIAKQQHILVIGYMPPYYPVLRDVLETRTEFTPTINYLTGQLDDFEKEYPFHYINFIDSPLFSNGDGMFHDLIHPTPQASTLMMQQLYDQFHNYTAKSS